MYALVDCNNFFVSCERTLDSSLENKPVVVLSNNDGCVVSRSKRSSGVGDSYGSYRLSNTKIFLKNMMLKVFLPSLNIITIKASRL
jgi:Nucleotidyltransferase/DNA polymerase involved in DNA repair